MVKNTYISLFSSAGVGCYGFKQENFECIATNELLQKRLQIQIWNHKCKYQSGYICGDILKPEIIQKIYQEIYFWKQNEQLTDITTIISTPPCQGMSIANHKKKKQETRNSLVVESLKLIKDVKPKTFVIENVRAFLTTLCIDVDGKQKKIADAINNNLAELYNIEFKVLNFKDYGSNSSRTRTLVIGIRKDIKVNPNALFPDKQKDKTIKEVIGNLEPLTYMNQVSKDDIYHSFREYNPEMKKWIKDLKEGESAFDNKDKSCVPHYFKNGIRIFTKNKNRDKYTRQCWNKTAACIHTRNDTLASQNTIHPSDNRVFSIRELMKFMTIPDSFKWSYLEFEKLNQLNLKEKETFIRKNELNIRQSIGEAVPTIIFSQIANKIKKNKI